MADRDEIDFEVPDMLIARAEGRGFVTHQDIFDCTPARVSTTETFERIVERLNDRGIAAFEVAPLEGSPLLDLEIATMGDLELVEDSPSAISELGTGRHSDSSVKCRFSFVCDRRWQDLPQTQEPGVLFCDRCRTQVHICMTAKEAVASIAAKRCVVLLFPHEKM